MAMAIACGTLSQKPIVVSLDPERQGTNLQDVAFTGDERMRSCR